MVNPDGDHKLFHTVLNWLAIMPMNGLGKQVLSGALIALAGFSLALLTIVPKVNTSATDIYYLKEGAKEERARTDKRTSEIVDLLKEHIKLNQDIIELVKVQNQLLNREKK